MRSPPSVSTATILTTVIRTVLSLHPTFRMICPGETFPWMPWPIMTTMAWLTHLVARKPCSTMKSHVLVILLTDFKRTLYELCGHSDLLQLMDSPSRKTQPKQFTSLHHFWKILPQSVSRWNWTAFSWVRACCRFCWTIAMWCRPSFRNLPRVLGLTKRTDTMNIQSTTILLTLSLTTPAMTYLWR